MIGWLLVVVAVMDGVTGVLVDDTVVDPVGDPVGDLVDDIVD